MEEKPQYLRPPRNGDTRTLQDDTREVFRNGTWHIKKIKPR